MSQVTGFFKDALTTPIAPYAHQVAPDYLEKRIFSSRLFSSDCSKIAISPPGRICGLAVANHKRYPDQKTPRRVYLNILLVAEGTNHDIAGRKLIHALLYEAEKAGKHGVKTSLQWGGLIPGIVTACRNELNFYSKIGCRFTAGELFLEMDFGSPIPVGNLSELMSGDASDIVIRNYQSSDFTPLYRWIASDYGAGWTHEVFNKVDERFERFNGYGLTEPYRPDDVFIVSYQDRICGFCVVQSRTGCSKGYFGPVALSQSVRGKGIGARLFYRAINHLRAEGKTCVGLWTDRDTYLNFYKKIGCRKRYKTVHARWDVLQHSSGKGE